VKRATGFYPRVRVDAKGGSTVVQAGGVLLTSTVKAAGLGVGLSAGLAPWWPVNAVHDPVPPPAGRGADERPSLDLPTRSPSIAALRAAADPARGHGCVLALRMSDHDATRDCGS
jgi:hypothetical protein